MTSYTYIPTPSEWSKYDFGRVSEKYVTIEDEIITHDDIAVNEATPLEEVKKSFLDAGYSKKTVKSMIKGLSELPEYGQSRGRKARRKED